MTARGYTYIDVPTSDLSSFDCVVRRLEYVRINIRSIIRDLPQDCEVVLRADYHPHNPGKIPFILIYCPKSSILLLPDPFDMIDRLEQWVNETTTHKLNLLAAAIEAPTWAQLLDVDYFPPE